MKVLQVYKDYYPPIKGGIECHLNLLANGLKDRGIDVEVLVSNRSNRFEEETCNGIRVFKAPQLGRFYSAPITPTFNFYLRSLGKTADIIHFHHPNPTADFSHLFTNLNKSLVVTYHSDIIRQDKLGILYSPFRKLFLNKADRIIATSPNYIKTSNILKRFEHKCSVIPLGIKLERFNSDSDLSKVSSIRKSYQNQPIILFVGCFRYYKGLNFLVSAMDRVEAQLILVGTGPEETRIRRIVTRKNLHDKVHFLGELSDEEVNAYYKACDIFVLPSHLRSEAFGIVQLEAMCCRKPVISTELGTGTTYVNIHKKTGLVIKPNDVEALASAIQYLIDHPEIRTDFGHHGYQRVTEHFSADRMVTDTIRLYEELYEENPSKKHIVKRKPTHENEKIKILRIISRMNIGGPSIHVKNLTEGLPESKYLTKLITGSVSPSEGDMSYITNLGNKVRINIPELQREINPFKDFVTLLKVIKILHRFKPDIVDSHTSKAGAIVRLAVFFYNLFSGSKIIIVHTFHGHVLEGYFSTTKAKTFQFFERVLAKMTNRIIAISESQKWELTTIYKIDNPDKIDTIKLGFDLSPFITCSRQRGILRQQLGLSERTILIGIVGRLAPIKNHRMFLDAGRRLIDRREQKNIKLVIVGDGEERHFLENYARDIGMNEFTAFCGWEKDVPMIYADLDILALTSLNEGTPVSVIEALAASVPVVTTGVGGIKDLLGRYEVRQPPRAAFKICERGILCPKDNADVFADALAYMIESGYLADRHRFARARDFVARNYAIDRLIHDVDIFYDKLIRSRQARQCPVRLVG